MVQFREFPERITVELTNRCNLECKFCPRHLVEMKPGNITSELFYKIIDEAKKYLPVCAVFFFRGESLLHPQLTEFIKYAKMQGLSPIQLASNGLELNDEIADKLIESGLDFISFSLDTNNEEVYKNSRKFGNLAQSRENVIKFARKCQNRKAKGLSAPEIQVSTVDVEDYKVGQKEFIDFWRKYADKVRVYIEHSNDSHLGSISKDLLALQTSRKPCKKLYTDIIVYYDGTIGLCNHDWDNKINIGNASDKSLRDIWNSQKYQELREQHEKDNIDNDLVCKNCDHWQMYYLSDGFLGKIYTKQE